MSLDQPLSDQEFNELDHFLLSERCPDDAMTMDMLHGYLTAIVIGPEIIPMSQWLPHVWGDDPDAAPQFESAQEFEHIIELLLRFSNEIAITFEVAPKDFEPLYCESRHGGKKVIDAEGWACGFWEGMQLRPEAWMPIWESELSPLLRPFYLLGADEIEKEELKLVQTPTQREKLAIEIEANLPKIHAFWHERRKPAIEPVRREAAKTGRNEACPCGSGKKFKQCCGSATTLH